VVLLVCTVAILLLYATLLVYRTRLERLRDENRAIAEQQGLADFAPA
jgi:hypothetical protein